MNEGDNESYVQVDTNKPKIVYGKRSSTGTIKSIRESQAQQNDLAQQFSKGLVESNEQALKQLTAIKNALKDVEKIQQDIAKIDASERTEKQRETLLKTKELYKELLKQQKDLQDSQGASNLILEEQNTTFEKLTDTYLDQKLVISDSADLLADIKDLHKEINGLTDEQLANQEKQASLRKQRLKDEKESLSNQKKQAKAINDEANKDIKQATRSALDSLTSKLQSFANTLNLSKITQSIARDTRLEIQEQYMASYDMSRSQFNSMKKDLYNSFDKRLYSTDAALQALQSMQQIGIGNERDARKYYEKILQGQDLLGMSTDTQTKLMQLQNRTGIESLNFYTNRVAKYLTVATNLSKQQLDQLTAISANTAAQMADIGISSNEFQANNQATTTMLGSVFNDNGSTAELYNQVTSRLASDIDAGALAFGMSPEDYKQQLEQGKDIFDFLQSGTGLINQLYKDTKNNAPNLQTEQRVLAGELGEDTVSLVNRIVQQEQKGTNFQAERQKYQVAGTDTSGITQQESARDATLTEIEKMKNLVGNLTNQELDWKVYAEIQQGFQTVIDLLGGISALLAASDMIDLFKSFSGKSGSGGVNLLGGKGTSLLGGTNASGSTSLTTKLFGAGSRLGGTQGISKFSYGNGTMGALSKAAGVGGLVWTAADAIGGATTMSNQLYSNKEGKVSTGNRVKGGVIGALSGTKVATSESAGSDSKATLKNVGGGALSGAGKGALIGSFFGPVGTLIGAGVGALAGGIAGAVKDKDRKKKEAEDKKLQEEQLKAQQETAKNTGQTSTYLSQGLNMADRQVLSYRPGADNQGGPIGGASAPASHTERPKYKIGGIGFGGGDFTGADGQYFGPWLVTSPYLAHRTYTNTQGETITDIHHGIDLAKTGENKIYSVCDGVATAAWGGSGGNQVTVSDGKNSYVYCHMKSFAIPQNQQINVEKGTQLGIMGATGNVTGQHLHFQVNKGGSWSNHTDPVPYLNAAIYNGDPNAVSYSVADGNDSSSSDSSRSDTNRPTTIKLSSFDTLGFGAPKSDISNIFEKKQETKKIEEPNITDVDRLVKGLAEIKQTLIDLSDRQTMDEKILAAITGKKSIDPIM